MRRAYLIILIGLSVIPFALVGCRPAPNYWADAKPTQKKILVSFPPLYAIANAVAGDDAYVLCMLTSRGPHGYEGAATDVFMLKNADLFIYNGLELDDLPVEKMIAGNTNGSLLTLNVGEALEKKHHHLMLHLEHDEHDHDKDKHKHGKEEHKHGEHDPHVWLGPKQAIEMTKIIAAKLSEIDKTKKEAYAKRADKFIAELKTVEEEGMKAFKSKKNKKIITQHESLGYFAEAFDLQIAGSIQLRPGVEPDAVTIGKLVKLCKTKDGPRVIAVEPQYSAAQAESLKETLKKDGIDVTIVIIDPLETAQIAKDKKFNPDPDYYLKGLRDNIEKLTKALP